MTRVTSRRSLAPGPPRDSSAVRPSRGPGPPPDAFPVRRWEPVFVLALSLIAGFRVFLFSAAFPLFCNVDEEAQFDLVDKYAHEGLPDSARDHISRGVAEVIA